MSNQSDQRQHDRSDDEYGQRPAERGTGTRTGTGMTQQPQFGGSTAQSETGPEGYRTDTNAAIGSTSDRRRDQRGGQQTGTRQTSGQRMEGQRASGRQTRRTETTGRRTSGQRMGDQQTGSQRTGGRQMTGQRTGTPTQSTTSQPSRSRAQSQPGEMQGGFRGVRTHSFDDHMTDELWIALEDFGELSHVAAWCATQCATGDPELGTCARACQDIAEIAALNEMLIARDSMFGPEMAATFIRVGEDALQTLRRYQQRHPHVRETAATIERTMNSCETLLRRVGGSSHPAGR